MGQVRFLGQMNRDEVAHVAANAIALVPLGATEQHGPHLPLLTDTIIVDAISRRALDILKTESDIVAAPPLPMGSSHHHLFACALSFSTDTYIGMLRDICISLVRSGFRRIFFVNGHGGNDLAMRMVCNELVLNEDVTVAACSYWTLTAPAPGGPDNAIDHAGRYETSIMLHLAPDLVSKPKTETGKTPAFFDAVLSQGLLINRHGEWSRIGGVTLPPHDASADLGARIVADRAAAMAEAIRRFDEASRDRQES
jgi:creatinine amidohydrolase